jgi:hypothetical protein
MRVFVEGIGLLGPGLNGWPASRSLLSGELAYVETPTVVTASDLLPPAERRRTGLSVKVALAAGREAFLHAGRDAAVTATVFASSSGDGENLDHICTTLASDEREISPTRFHNSVHNAPAGYWSIATRSQAQSTSLCAHDASFAAGLLDAVTQIAVDGKPVALITYDQPYPEPLHAVRPLTASFGMALVLTAQATERAFATLDANYVATAASPTRMADEGLERIRASVPAARSLPLLAALARAMPELIVVQYGGQHLSVAVSPWPCP